MWMLLIPFAVIALLHNGFIAEAWQDGRRDDRIRSIEAKAQIDPALTRLVEKSKKSPLSPDEHRDYVRLIHGQTEKFEQAAVALKAMPLREKDALVHAGIVKRYENYTVAYRGLADAYDHNDANAVMAARENARKLLANSP